MGIGIDPTLNPYIDRDESVGWITDLGFIPVGADVDSWDWRASSPKVLLRILRMDSKGHFVLLHDGEGNGAQYTVQILKDVIEKVKSEGYTFVTVSDLLGIQESINIQNILVPASTDTEYQSDVSELNPF